ncbi:hypothetical protein [Couchioplanes caeruleus]|uniref:Uncharacterized protein n=2 Tax=Couchioplanes caeruleus TaxID=56438 RepID=A0A1K0FII8_9ACTN|nr:hypothetical protein [Couchioplanes caeruleus]OJF12544.1 hypothetical protein BG844_20105 [Couchioplanes caeruleus subsp. caeruleus]ROP31478.1 hypothetical protein EDD30_4387 [Couchioplanes caeruleus]
MKDSEPVIVQLYCRFEVAVEDLNAVLNHAAQGLRDAEIDWSNESNTLDEAVKEMKSDLAESVASLVDFDRVLGELPGLEVRRGRYWAEAGPPSERFQPGFGVPQ